MRGSVTGAPPMASPVESESSSPGVYSPSFVKPAPLRRKSTALGLTIMTPGSASFNAPQQPVVVPPTPGGGGPRPAPLRQFQSSPTIPLQTSALPPIDLSRATPQYASAISEGPADETDLRPQSREDRKDPAYPNGPICIYEPYIDLYFEPTAEEAARYDVVFNVASEVVNPLGKDGRTSFVKRDIKAAIDALPKRSPTMSPARPSNVESSDQNASQREAPEYIHIPWEHNTEIVPGTAEIPRLHDIIRVIDDFVISGKRILIHCQCGVSRSASLVVAYGLYKNPTLSVQQAYDTVKAKSRWIGPNMSLIMQLQEYRNELLKGSSNDRGSSHPRSKILHGRDISHGSDGGDSSVPQTAPLPNESSKMTPSPIDTSRPAHISSGPSSAPSEFFWSTETTVDSPTAAALKPAVVPIYPDRSIVNAAGHVSLPSRTGAAKLVTDRDAQVLTADSSLIEQGNKDKEKHLSLRTKSEPSLHTPTLAGLPILSDIATDEVIDSARSAEFSMSPLRPVVDDPSFGITSPRESTVVNPFFHVNTNTQSSELPMSPISPPDVDTSLGLTSPRFGGFPGQAGPGSFPLFSAVRPSPEGGASDAEARSALKSQLGFSSGASSADLHQQYGEHRTSATPPLQQRAASPPVFVAPPASEPDFEDALMSPRATEFTSNPFHDALAAQPTPSTAPGGKDGATIGASEQEAPISQDPRSPPLKGASPIVRSILDVLEQ